MAVEAKGEDPECQGIEQQEAAISEGRIERQRGERVVERMMGSEVLLAAASWPRVQARGRIEIDRLEAEMAGQVLGGIPQVVVVEQALGCHHIVGGVAQA